MAKRKTSSELDEKLKSSQEIIDSTDELMFKLNGKKLFTQEEVEEITQNMETIRKLKDGLSQDGLTISQIIEMKRKLDQRSHELRMLLKEKSRGFINDSEFKELMDQLASIVDDLQEKIDEIKQQCENLQTKKRGKNNQNKLEKLERHIENIQAQHKALNKIVEDEPTKATIAQGEALKDIICFFEYYVINTEYNQLAPFMDMLYEEYDEDLSIHEPQQQKPEEDSKEADVTNQSGPGQKPSMPLPVNGGNYMENMRKNGFVPEKKKMPSITEQDLNGQFSFFDYFESSSQNIPRETDYYPTSANKEKVSPRNILPKRKIIDEHIFSKFDVDTLFFIFYFQKNSYEQYLAAQELKTRTWRFHKKFQTWFKRLETPKIVEEDHEQGTYAFFDFEPNGWVQRRKADFIFKFQYLEDEKL